MSRLRTNLVVGAFLSVVLFFIWSHLSISDRSDLASLLPKLGVTDIKQNTKFVKQSQAVKQALNEPVGGNAQSPVTETTDSDHVRPPSVYHPPIEKQPEPEIPKLENNGYAYVFYATSNPYACSVLVNIHRLQDVLNTTLPIHVLVSTDVTSSLTKAVENMNATVYIQPPPPLNLTSGGGGYYQDCLLKLLAFKLHVLNPDLKRVLIFDADQLIMKKLDHLFSGLPEVDLAAPRAYWLAKGFLASTFMMINLSDRLWSTVKNALSAVGYNKFDMDLINDLLGDEVMMLSGEYATLNSHWEDSNLPRWYHPEVKFNMTTIDALNKLSKMYIGDPKNNNRKRQAESTDAENGTDAAEAIFSDQDSRPASITSPVLPPDPGGPVAALVLPHHGPSTDDVSANIVPAAKPLPRFPPGHPLSQELYRLNEAAAVIHFTAAGKPWSHSAGTVALARPDAHPLLAQQVELWRQTAAEV